MPTKADRIRALLKTGTMTTSEIATKIGVLPEYVRVIKQRDNPESWLCISKRTGDRVQAKEAARLAYRKARKDGKSCGQAQGAYSTAYKAKLSKTRVDLVS